MKIFFPLFFFISFCEKKREGKNPMLSKDNFLRNFIIFVNQFVRTHYLILAGLVILVIIILVIYTINFANNSKQDKTFIFIILPSSARQLNESSSQKNIKKYGNYYFSSYALLIKRLAISHLRINKQHICIFGRGKEENFNINSIISNNKIIVQLTLDEIYETESSQSELEIIPYKNVEDIIISMRSIIDTSKCKNPNIILFLYDQSEVKSFGKLKFLELYLKILNIPHSSLYIYNECCKSNSIIENYFAISEIISSFTPKITQDELFFLALVAKEMCPKGNFVQLDAMQSLDRKYFKYISKIKFDNTFSYLCLFAKNDIQQEQLYQKFPSFFSQYEIDNLAKFVQCYVMQYRIPDDYEIIHLIFERGIKVIQKALKRFNCSFEKFLNFLKNMKSNKQNFADKQYRMHPNHFIVTSSHENCRSPTYGTIRVNENTKIIPGSPVMASYIIEVLMNRSLSKKSINNIKKMVYGDYEGLTLEYAIQCLESKKKKWVCLHINYWESKSIFRKKILIDQDKNFMTKHSIEEVMNSVGFKLLSRCKIQFDGHNLCVTNKMQPLFKTNKKVKVIGIRLTDNYDLSEFEYIFDDNDKHEEDNKNNYFEGNKNNDFENNKNSIECNQNNGTISKFPLFFWPVSKFSIKKK
ncbi:hypothetical protein M9Y10_042636 [Tritrichomonas musculus]|uniref:Uncharacterized protein n=1 Tax=Tritrichomonas musculus TaxID=1915356 RepID=A0ABR2JXU3_9EUKA